MKYHLIRLVCFLLCLNVRAEEGLSDPRWVSGKLENGLQYFIRQNAKPDQRVELRLVVNAGSILEADDQQGLAHFLEHSAFNGTVNFEKNQMVDFLESLGMGFGPDLNAYTSFDETVYQLKVPTQDPAIVDKAFLILSDWAGGITNTDEALANERGVVIEEWRGRRGAAARIRDQQFPVMFPDSRYAERLPIGTIEVLEGFDFERLRDFYRDWYRPDLMSVVAVGDLDIEKTRAMIEAHFSDLQVPEKILPRETFVHPPHTETMVGSFSDPELTDASVTLLWKMPPQPVNSEADYVEDIKAGLAGDMLNQRLYERTQQANPPFLKGQSYQGSYTRGGDVFLLYAGVKDADGAYETAAKTLLIEAERAKRFGFTQGELDRAMSRRLRQMEKSYAERDNTESAVWAREIVRHALTGEYTPGIEKELAIHRQVFEEVTLAEIQAKYQSWFSDENRVMMATGPETNGENRLPGDEALLALYGEVANMTLTAYEDSLTTQALIETVPVPGQILEKTVNEDLGLIHYTLSNGVKVTLKSTDFKEDEVLMNAWRAGGMNLAEDAEWLSARMASPVADATGIGAFSQVDLQKMLSGKLVGLNASLSMDQDLLSGSASPQDLDSLLQLIHLRMTSVREDANAFYALQQRLRESVRNRLADPKQEFAEMVEQTMRLYHPRTSPLTLEEVDALDMQGSLAFFHKRFGDAYGFEFLFTGNVDAESFEPKMLTWLASLPSTGKQAEAAFFASDFPKDRLRREMHKGLESVSQVQMVWTQEDFVWDYASRHRIQSMVAALRIRLREVLREEEGGTYHVSAWTPMQHYPSPRVQMRIAFTCDPARVEALIQNVESLLAEFKAQPLDESYAQKVKEGQWRRRELDLKENSFWNYVIPFYAWHKEDPQVILQLDSYVATVTPESIRETAAAFFNTPHRSVFILAPAEPAGVDVPVATGDEHDENQ